jgi:transposase
MVAFASQLVGRYRMSRREAPDLLGQLLDLPPPSLGSMEAFTREMSTALLPAYGEVQTVVRGSDRAGVDETPWKLGGKKQWLWVARAEAATLFHLGASRGSDELRRFLGSAFRGILSSDRWCAYQSHEGLRQLCWAHLKRNFKKLELRGGEAARFAKRGVRVCRLVFKTFERVREEGLGREQLRIRMRPIQEYFRRLIESGASSASKQVARMCRNLLKLWRWLWTFVEKDVELTNNAAERALRAAVLWRKGCFGNQSESGMRYAERILTIAATCRQQGIPLLDFLSHSIVALRSGTQAPKILPTH